MAGGFGREGADLLVPVRVTPRADRDEISGTVTLADGTAALAVRVRAVPEDGRANAAVAAVLAAALGVPKGRVRLEAGAARRRKVFRVLAADAAVEAALGRLFG